MNSTTSNTFLLFSDNSGENHLVSIDSILEGGTPVDSDNGGDMNLESSNLLDQDGERI